MTSGKDITIQFIKKKTIARKKKIEIIVAMKN